MVDGTERELVLVGPRPPQPNEWKSMLRYTDGVATAVSNDFRVTRFSASHWNPPPIARKLSARYRDHIQLPRKWVPAPEIVHFTDIYVAVHARRFDSVRLATLHDFIALDLIPRWSPALFYWRAIFAHSLRSVRDLDGLITPSLYTASRAMRETGVDERQISVVPVLVPDQVRPPGRDHVRRDATILSVGTTAPYKNLPLLLHALASPKLRGARLMRVGSPLTPELRALASRLGLTDRIEERTHVADGELLSAFHEATVLAQPSLTEGFGMPVAEALATGLPAVTSDGGSLPEVAGPAGLVVPFRSHSEGPIEPEDAENFADALAKVLQDRALQERMSVQGLAEAERFRTPAVRRALLDAYRKAAGR